jgi:amino acid adenylation domain-containing protein
MKQVNPALACQADNLFNVIFTSGSTGKPKGVMVPHKGIINRLLWMQNAYPLDSSDRILQKTPYSFDVSVWELFWPLIIGAELVYAKPEGHKEADYLRDTINKYNISTLHFVPTMLGIFLQTADIENCSSIKRVFCSGEALQLEHEKRFFQRLDKAELHNLYGPTEASVDVSYFACRPDSDYSSVPIGKPVSNTQLYVLDKHLAPVPVGVVGELYIGGIQLARGYLKREELTRDTFIDNPFLTEAWAAEANLSDKLYKTGDLTRYLPDGNIEYIGRVDFQVKVRGLRIELGEIENVLHQHPSIGETLVITKDLGAGNVIIAAYCVPKGEAPDIAALRQFLAQHLPNYMIPNAFIMLDRIPISANGKADRKALPDPTSACSVSTEYVAPGNSTELKLAQIWAETLGVEKIGIHDNFFELGGHSVLAMQIANKALAHFEVELELIKLFENPTIAAIAEMIEGKLAEQQLLMNDEDGDGDEELVI